MSAELLNYDPSTVEPEIRAQMAGVLRARNEILRASADVAELRARAWDGEAGATDLIDLKAADLAKIREDYINRLRPFLKEAVDTEGLKDMFPMLVVALLQNFKVPAPVVLEAIGVDVDQIKLFVNSIKDLIEDL